MSASRRNTIFIVLCSTCVVLTLLSTALNTALPAMARDLQVESTLCQWVVSGYALALATIMPLTAYLVTRFKTRKLYLLALALYLASAVVCALSSSFALLMGARVVQACANGLISSLTQITILSVFDEGERGTRMGWFGFSVGVAPVVAPTLGGLVVDALGWRAIFWIVAGLIGICLVVSLAVMGNVLETRPKTLDALGFVLSALTFGGFTLSLGNIPSLGLTNAATIVPLAIGVIAGALFVHRQLTCDDPLLDLRTFAVAPYRASVIGSAALYAVMMGSAAALPVFMQTTLGYSATIAGATVLPGVAAMALVNPIAGKVFDRFGIRALVCASGVLLVASNVLMCVPALNESVIGLAVLALARYLAIGLVQMPLATWGNTSVPKEMLASGTALLTSLRNVAGAIGVAVFVSMLGALGVTAAYVGMAATSLALFLALAARK